jgi:hypothetical protein
MNEASGGMLGSETRREKGVKTCRNQRSEFLLRGGRREEGADGDGFAV